MSAREQEPEKDPGKGVDAEGRPVIDPTANVIALNEAANRRQDDLRDLNNRYLEALIANVAAISELREQHAKEIRQLEADRLEKIRQVDVLAGNTSAERALEAIKTLASVTATSAETLRVSVAQTATTIAAQLDQRLGAVIGRVESLEKSSYTGAGRQAVADPALVELAASIRKLEQSSSTTAGRDVGQGQAWGVLLAAVSLIGSLIAVGTVVFKSGAAVAPQVIYSQPPQPGTVTVPPPTVAR